MSYAKIGQHCTVPGYGIGTNPDKGKAGPILHFDTGYLKSEGTNWNTSDAIMYQTRTITRNNLADVPASICRYGTRTLRQKARAN
ncbi:unnamed protein product [Fusarium venenatum]|uniref:Uncharacterized protein n=1 Tax=Fusarium venenatum TaxID=56646 RepID=A0A2L2TWE1_9HYPO|nr:uncharacterized protein FVRRES_08873 [Fusarium venenatum]CEI68796.1 unnamed protein product [Fusarium venenatum]